MKKILLLIISFSIVISLYSQKPNIVGFKASYGSILPHHKDMRVLIKKHIKEFNLQLGIQTNGNYEWQKVWKYPEIGFGLFYADLGNPAQLGNSKAFYLYIKKAIVSKGIWSLNSYVALGTAHLSKFFNPTENYLNFTNGSAFNIFANINIENSFRIKNYIVYADLGLTHFSNGGTQMPNLGLNLIATSMGVKYIFRENKITKNPHILDIPKFDFYFLQSFTMHDDDFSLSDKKNIAMTTTADYGYYVSKSFRISAGIDIFYDDVAPKYLIYQGTTEYSRKDYFSLGLHAGFTGVFGKLQFSVQPIFFFYKKYKESILFERYAFRYHIGKHFIVGAGLIADYFNAKFIEPSIGFRF